MGLDLWPVTVNQESAVSARGSKPRRRAARLRSGAANEPEADDWPVSVASPRGKEARMRERERERSK